MNPPRALETDHQKPKVFSAMWSDPLGAAIVAATPEQGYRMSLVGSDCHQVIDAVVGSSRVDLQACKLEYSIVSPK